MPSSSLRYPIPLLARPPQELPHDCFENSVRPCQVLSFLHDTRNGQPLGIPPFTYACYALCSGVRIELDIEVLPTTLSMCELWEWISFLLSLESVIHLLLDERFYPLCVDTTGSGACCTPHCTHLSVCFVVGSSSPPFWLQAFQAGLGRPAVWELFAA